MARFTAALLVGVFKDDFLPSHHTLRTRGDTVWTVLQAGTRHTLICSLKTRRDRLVDRQKQRRQTFAERKFKVSSNTEYRYVYCDATRWEQHMESSYNTILEFEELVCCVNITVKQYI